MSVEVTNFIGYSLGTVLCGFIIILPLWGGSVLWNRVSGSRINPWVLPLVAILATTGLVVFGAISDADPWGQGVVILIGLVPSNLWCLFRFRGARIQSRQDLAL